MSGCNVNFPDSLDISPSTCLGINQAYATPIEVSDDLFGYAAQRDAIGKYGIAGRIWEAAYALSIYIDPPSNLQFDPPFVTTPSLVPRCPITILELGSGAGMTSSQTARTLYADDMLISTDLPEVCPLLEHNLKVHLSSEVPCGSSHPLIFVRPFSWGQGAYGIDIASELLTGTRILTHVVCSDLVYFPELLAPLLRSLLQVTSPPFSLRPDSMHEGVTVVISYKLRSFSKETPFWAAFGLWFHFEPVLVKNHISEDYGWQRFGAASDDTIFIFVAHRRPESVDWAIPADDVDLLAGRGAMGNALAKADDTFETLLFMTLETSAI